MNFEWAVEVDVRVGWPFEQRLGRLSSCGRWRGRSEVRRVGRAVGGGRFDREGVWAGERELAIDEDHGGKEGIEMAVGGGLLRRRLLRIAGCWTRHFPSLDEFANTARDGKSSSWDRVYREPKISGEDRKGKAKGDIVKRVYKKKRERSMITENARE
jgi:hypothetical protein